MPTSSPSLAIPRPLATPLAVSVTPAGAWTHPLWARLRDPSYAASQQVAADPTTPEEKP